jgi:hypothetical protein
MKFRDTVVIDSEATVMTMSLARRLASHPTQQVVKESTVPIDHA